MKATSKISFSPPLTYSRDYPAPAFSIYPRYSCDSGEDRRTAPSGAVATFHAARARYAFAMIACARLVPGNTVLVPAYHCPAMVEPFLWAGCSVAFYPVTRNLEPVANRLEEGLADADAVLFTRYFGFDQNMATQVALARKYRCLAIEDLAHAAFTPMLYGDVGVTSLTKFFPQLHGSEIWCRDPALARSLQRTLENRQLGQVGWVLDRIRRKIRKELSHRTTSGKRGHPLYRYFNEAELKRPAVLCTARISDKSSSGQPGQRRRSHYLELLAIASRSPLGVPLYPELKSETTPYMLPFLLHSAESFHRIRGMGIPLFRWEELAPTDCAVSAAYRSRLIQIPCHQDMSAEDFALIERGLLTASNVMAFAGKTA